MNRGALGLCLLLGLAALPARAGDQAVTVSLKPKGTMGKEFPSIQIHINEPIAGFELVLERGDGKTLDIKGGGPPGVTRNIDLPQTESRLSYKGELKVNFPNAEKASLPLAFDTELIGSLKLTVKPEDVDQAARKVTFTSTQPLKKVHLRVTMDTGFDSADRDITLKPEDAPTYTVQWPPAPGQALIVELTAYDVNDFWTRQEFSPWRVDIPHEEVAFPPRRFDLPDSEKPKLDKSYERISEAVKKYDRVTDLKLYIVGHTDTVGPAEKNKSLSLNRALSLGSYLRRKGLKIPILCEGYGEGALKVGTPDETDEPQNRRAEYILAIDSPTVKGAPTPPNWHRL